MILNPFSGHPFTPEERAEIDNSELYRRGGGFFKYQEPVFYAPNKTLVIHWTRRGGKSWTLGSWAVTRCCEMGKDTEHLVTVLSNSKQNGIEFITAAARFARLMAAVMGASAVELPKEEDMAAVRFETMRMEIKITIGHNVSRIQVLSANPRTARGFGGDLILDEFAFHEDSEAIWDAAEPIVAGNPDYQCRVASTGNGRYNMFYRMANPASSFLVSRVRRSEAWGMGLKIYDLQTGKEQTPAEARARALDKASYDQNYECAFNDENSALLTHELINRAEIDENDEHGRPQWFICERDWTYSCLQYLRSLKGPLGIGMDIGKTRDLTVLIVGERVDGQMMCRAMLRMSSMRLMDQQHRLDAVCSLPNFGRLCGDCTGLGEKTMEEAQAKFGHYRCEPVHMATKEKRTVRNIQQEDSAYVTELMALDLLQTFEDSRIRIFNELEFRDSLRKPERISTARGVKVAATRDEAGHADEFWALCLMHRALKTPVYSGRFIPSTGGHVHEARLKRADREFCA